MGSRKRKVVGERQTDRKVAREALLMIAEEGNQT